MFDGCCGNSCNCRGCIASVIIPICGQGSIDCQLNISDGKNSSSG
jgi:hypothetical protein